MIAPLQALPLIYSDKLRDFTLMIDLYGEIFYKNLTCKVLIFSKVYHCHKYAFKEKAHNIR